MVAERCCLTIPPPGTVAWNYNDDARFEDTPFAPAEYDEDKVYAGGSAFAATDLPTVQIITTKDPARIRREDLMVCI